MKDSLGARPKTPTAFISYSRESQAHIDRVVELADKLRLDGIDCLVDDYEEAPSEGWRLWMERQVRNSDYVLTVCTNLYRTHFDGLGEPGRGLGVAWERSMISAALYENSGQNDKFIPILFTSSDRENIPTLLSSTTYYDLSQQDGYERVVRRLTSQPRRVKPPVGPIKQFPPKGEQEELKRPLFTDQDYRTVVDLVAERVQFLEPGIMPRVSKRLTIEEAITRGISGDAAIRVIRQLSTERILLPLGMQDGDELLVDLERIEVKREQSAYAVRQPISTSSAEGSPSLQPSFNVRFRSGDEAGEPNYYVEVGLRHEAKAAAARTARLVCVCYSPRNAWDSEGGLWPVNFLPNHTLSATTSYLDRDNYSTMVGLLPVKEFPGFHVVAGFEVRLGDYTVFPLDQVLLSTLEVFGPDLILDWRLDVPEGVYRGTERCPRPRDTSLPPRFTLRSRLNIAVRNSRRISTEDGDRIVCDVTMPEYKFSIESSCWAESINQWGNDLTARTLIKEALAPAMQKVQRLKADTPHASSDTKLNRLEYQLALETPIRLDDYYSRLLDHHEAQGDFPRLTSLREEWARIISEHISQIPIPHLNGEMT